MHIDDRQHFSYGALHGLLLLTLFVASLSFTTNPSAVAASAIGTKIIAPANAKNVPGQPSVTYTAAFSSDPPALQPGESIAGESWHWSDNCSPQDGSGLVSVTASSSSPGTVPSTVTCSALWSIKDSTGKIGRTVIEQASATTAVNFGAVWTPGTITGVTLISPQNQSTSPAVPSVMIASPGAALRCEVSQATANDEFTYAGTTTKVAADLSYKWECSIGSFAGGGTTVTTTTSQQPIWYAPSADSLNNGIAATITAEVAGADSIGPYDSGSRSHVPVKESLTVYIPQITVTGGAFGPADVYVGQTVSAKVSAAVTPTIPGVTDNVSWASNVLWFSHTGVAGTFHPYIGGNAFTNSSTTLAGTFQGHYLDPGFYILEVTASDTLKDTYGNALCSVSGCGLVNGSWSFIEKKTADLDYGSSEGGDDKDTSWYSQPWTTQDINYFNARQEVEQEAQATSVARAAVEYWDKERDQTVPSSIDVYCAGYAVWLESKVPATTEVLLAPSKVAGEVENTPGSRGIPDWHSCEYVRMRYLFESAYYPHASLIAAGKRLLIASPNDTDVIEAQLRLLNIGTDPAQTKVAFALCRHLLQIQPNTASTYKSIALAYYAAYAWNNDPDDRLQVIDNLRKFLQLSTPDDPFNAFAKDRVAELSTET